MFKWFPLELWTRDHPQLSFPCVYVPPLLLHIFLLSSELYSRVGKVQGFTPNVVSGLAPGTDLKRRFRAEPSEGTGFSDRAAGIPAPSPSRSRAPSRRPCCGLLLPLCRCWFPPPRPLPPHVPTAAPSSVPLARAAPPPPPFPWPLVMAHKGSL